MPIIQNLSFDELKTEMRNCHTKMLMFVIMLANGELMDRLDKNILDKEQQCTNTEKNQ